MLAKNDINQIWRAIARTTQKIPVKEGENYEISIDLKADDECLVRLSTADFDNYGDDVSCYYNLTTEWKTCKIITGTAPHDWVDGRLDIQVGLISTVCAKNLQYKKLEYGTISANPYANNYNDLGKVTYETKSSDSITVKFEDGIIDSGITIFPCKTFEFDNLYKVSFDVKTNVDFTGKDNDMITFWLHNTNGRTMDSGGGHGSYTAGEKRTVTLYMPTIRNPKKTKQTYTNANMWFSVKKIL